MTHRSDVEPQSVSGPARKRGIGLGWLLLILLTNQSSLAAPVGAAFTYQGQLKDGGAPAAGVYDFEFKLFDAATGGLQVGSTLQKGDVAVSGGLFSVSLDFGATAFSGQSRFLQVGVRPGVSTGAFDLLGARQELTPAPNALHSATTGDPSVQRRTVTPSCSVGQYVRAIAADGTPTCATDANSGGTVTSVASGSGLAGGPITGSGTISVAPLGITSAMIANGAVGSAQINLAQVQARVTTMCPAGQFLRGLNADGSIVCEAFNLPPIISTVDDPVNIVGAYNSIAIGADGFPVISYHDPGANALLVAKCVNASCSGASTVSTVDASGLVGRFTSIAIGFDGLPVISYHNYGAGTLKVAKCADAACATPATVTTVDDPVNSVGAFTSLTIGLDGFPVVSYVDTTTGALKVAKCVNAACTGTSTITTVEDAANTVGFYNSIKVGSDGFPVISYNDFTAGTLKVAKCVNAACTGTSTITTVDDPANVVGRFTSLAIGADGFPVISYEDVTGGDLKVAKCVNAACTGTSVITTVDGALSGAFLGTAIAVDAAGLPVIGYRDFGLSALKVAKCVNAACSGTSTLTIVEAPPGGGVSEYISIAIGADGFPILSYWLSSGVLRAAKCNKSTCAP